ncbi:hypothetical protein [Streptomyces sp. NPDC051994]|uniref:hypothetical protein n=1 Tax=unclassified Streptomyces TaxID=2593676 RepID=UPI003446B76D
MTLVASDALLEAADVPAMFDLLGATEISRRPDVRPGCTVLTLNIPDAPHDATSIRPIFQKAADGTISVMSMGWH